MPGEPIQTPAQVATPAAPAAPATQVEPKNQPPEDVAALKGRLAYLEAEKSSANKEAQGLRKRLRDFETAQKAAEDKLLAEKGQFKELADRLKKDLDARDQELEPLRTFKAGVEQREGEERSRREAQAATEFEKLPEDWRSLVPPDGNLREKELAIHAYRRASGARPAPPMPPTAPRPQVGPPAELQDIKDEEFIELNNPQAPMARRQELARRHQEYLDSKARQG